MPEKEEEESFVKKIVNVETLSAIILALLAFTAGYSVLKDDQEELGMEVNSIKLEQRVLQKSVHDAQIDLSRVRTNQEFFRRRIDEQRDDIKEILKYTREAQQ